MGVLALMYCPLLKPLFVFNGHHSGDYWSFLYLSSIVIVFVSVFCIKPIKIKENKEKNKKPRELQRDN